MRSVDLEAAGSSFAEQVSSRVSYMRVPEFFGDLFREEAAANNNCGVVVGLKIVGVEYINNKNVLVTVLAARPRTLTLCLCIYTMSIHTLYLVSDLEGSDIDDPLYGIIYCS